MILNRKGITPIVATILLLLLTVAVGGFTYMWMTRMQKGITGGITERLTRVLTGMKASATIESIWDPNTTDDNLSISIRNIGDVGISINATRDTAYCNGKLMSILTGASLSSGERKVIVVNCSEPTIDNNNCCCPLPKDSVTIKITTPNVEVTGNFYNKSAIGSPYCS